MLRRWLIVGFGVAGLAVALGSGYAWASRPESYADAVRKVLDHRHIAYTGLEVREICLPDPHCVIASDGTRTFATIVIATTQIHGSTAGSGLIICYDRRGDCYLDLPSLGIQRAPLRDLRGVRLIPKQVVREIARIARWLQAIART